MAYVGASAQESLLGGMFGLVLSFTASGLTLTLLIGGKKLPLNQLTWFLVGLLLAEAIGVLFLSRSAGYANSLSGLKDLYAEEQLLATDYYNVNKGQLSAVQKAQNEYLVTCKNVATIEALAVNGGPREVANFAQAQARDTTAIDTIPCPTLVYAEGVTIPQANTDVKKFWQDINKAVEDMKSTKSMLLSGAEQRMNVLNAFKVGKTQAQIGSLTSIESSLTNVVALKNQPKINQPEVREIDLERLEAVTGGLVGRLVGLANIFLLFFCAICEYLNAKSLQQNDEKGLRRLSKEDLSDFEQDFINFLVKLNFKDLTKDDVQILLNAGEEKILAIKKEFPLQEDIITIIRSNTTLDELKEAGKPQQVLRFLKQGFELSDLEGLEQDQRDAIERRFTKKVPNRNFFLTTQPLWELLRDGLQLQERDCRFFSAKDVKTFNAFFKSPVYEENHRMSRLIADNSSKSFQGTNWFRKLADMINSYEDFIKVKTAELQAGKEETVEREDVEKLINFTVDNTGAVTFSYPNI